ncbi:unnamed protein product [Acanthoscelides obtectus]|uniref:Uncharacterized protein n=1 Tax=Acanthoscelides obtectus TaxID=200917 RepID=A0A9P0LZA3_ACAOB|nr:unnamed protein product [Acanthoscelides obtectus]CAK1650146.1 hypothetical protein AOBTE_LOCUS16635 [Acanthoscelides obtectus]
MSLTKHFSIL